MENLKRMENLTRRYARTRIGAAGLGPLWASILVVSLMVLIGNYIYAEFAASGSAYPTLWRFLDSNTLITPFWIKVAAIAVSILTWLEVTGLQLLVDKPFGVAIHHDSSLPFMRVFIPIFFIAILFVAMGANIGEALAIRDNSFTCHPPTTMGNDVKSLFEMMDINSYIGWTIITAWGVIWALTAPDTASRGLACLLTITLFPIMSSTLNDVDIVMAALSLIGFLVLTILGLRQFFAFLKVRKEINALPVSE